MSKAHGVLKRPGLVAASTFAAYLLICVVLFYRLILFEPKSYSLPWDFTGFHLPQAVFLSDRLHHGNLPLWDPYVYCGRPFAANIQTQSLYLPRIVSSFMGGFFGVHGILYAMELEYLGHVYLAGVFTFLLARRLGLALIPAALSSIVYSCGCYFSSQAEHVGATEAACWLPSSLVGSHPDLGWPLQQGSRCSHNRCCCRRTLWLYSHGAGALRFRNLPRSAVPPIAANDSSRLHFNPARSPLRSAHGRHPTAAGNTVDVSERGEVENRLDVSYGRWNPAP